MRQHSSPPSQSSPSQTLHPILQAALDSLDVELEEELTRYRRQRYRQVKHGKHIPAWQPGSSQKSGAGRSPQLPLMNPLTGAAETVTRDELSDAEFDAEPLVEMLPRSELPAASLTAVPSSINSVAFSTINPSAHPSVQPSLMAPLLPEHPEVAVDRTLDRLRELAIAAIGNTQASSAQAWDNVAAEPVPPVEEMPRSDLSDFSDSPDDYLESTEELLQSVAEEPPNLQVERESRLLDSLLTPLGIGSMVLLLLSSATLGYVIMHPSSLDLLSSPEYASDGKSDGKVASGASATPFASPLIPDSPNLAAEEFVNLNLDNLSTIPGNTSPVLGQSTLPTVPQTSPVPDSGSQQSSSQQNPSSSSRIAVDHAPASATSTESEVTSSAPEPEPVAPEPESISEATVPAAPPTLPAIDSPAPESAPETAPPAPEDVASETATSELPAPEVATTTATGSASGSYYVVMPYNGDPSLEQAREVVPQAYVRNFDTGASVQLGVFSSAENAQELIRELEAKGIAAEVYQP